MAPSTIHRWINDGFLPAEQVTPGAPWRIRITPELRARLVGQAPKGYLAMREAIGGWACLVRPCCDGSRAASSRQ